MSQGILKVLQPEGWAPAKGYANGIAARALQNIVATLACAGAGPQHMARMTWYVKDKKEYVARGRELGKVYQEVMGKNYPAMTLVQVADLVEDRALVEIEVTAVKP